MFALKVVEENFRPLLQKVLCLWRKQIFVYIDEDFAIHSIRPKFLSLLMTGIIRIGVTERGSFKKYSEAVLLYLNKPSIALVIELGRCNVTF